VHIRGARSKEEEEEEEEEQKAYRRSKEHEPLIEGGVVGNAPSVPERGEVGGLSGLSISELALQSSGHSSHVTRMSTFPPYWPESLLHSFQP